MMGERPTPNPSTIITGNIKGSWASTTCIAMVAFGCLCLILVTCDKGGDSDLTCPNSPSYDPQVKVVWDVNSITYGPIDLPECLDGNSLELEVHQDGTFHSTSTQLDIESALEKTGTLTRVQMETMTSLIEEKIEGIPCDIVGSMDCDGAHGDFFYREESGITHYIIWTGCGSLAAFHDINRFFYDLTLSLDLWAGCSGDGDLEGPGETEGETGEDP